MERCKLPSGSGQSPAAKCYLVHFGLKNASAKNNFKYIFTKIHKKMTSLLVIMPKNVIARGSRRNPPPKYATGRQPYTASGLVLPAGD